MRADLHVHSNASDGTDPPAEVMRRAARAGLDAVALTDHDTVAGHGEARRASTPDLILVPGLELSGRLADRSVHLLAYLFDPDHAELAAESAGSATTGSARPAMVGPLAGLGVDIAGTRSPLSRATPWSAAHIARAMAASGAMADRAAPSPAMARQRRAGLRGPVALDPVHAVRLHVRRAGRATSARPPAGQRRKGRLQQADHHASHRTRGLSRCCIPTSLMPTQPACLP